MSAIDSLTTSGGAPASGGDAFAAMSSEDFVQLIFAELQNQDPLSPSDTSALLEQVNMIRSIESDTAQIDRLEDLIRQNDITSSGSLVGSFVTGRTSSGVETAGYVDSVSITRDGPVLNLSSGSRVPIANLDEVVDPALLAGGAENGAPVLAQAIADQLATVGEPFTFAVPAGTFSDEEPSENLTYTATLGDGSDLPGWLSFNGVTRAFSGVAPADAPGQLTLRITAVDSYNARASTSFRLTVNGSEG